MIMYVKYSLIQSVQSENIFKLHDEDSGWELKKVTLKCIVLVLSYKNQEDRHAHHYYLVL